jgi:hypothetical protein
MRSLTFGLIILWIIGLTAGCSPEKKSGEANKRVEKPNILFILKDNLGKEWISSYGAEEIKTPNLDKPEPNRKTYNFTEWNL